MNDDDDLRRLSWVRALCASGAAEGIRVGANLTLREVAADVQVSPATVHRWETGSAKPTGPRALAYAKALERIGGRRRVA
jgi:DNA-binding transcriptional regulator YiaG